MLQLYKNIQTDFLGQIFLELFQFKTRSLFWDTQYVPLHKANTGEAALCAPQVPSRSPAKERFCSISNAWS